VLSHGNVTLSSAGIFSRLLDDFTQPRAGTDAFGSRDEWF